MKIPQGITTAKSATRKYGVEDTDDVTKTLGVFRAFVVLFHGFYSIVLRYLCLLHEVRTENMYLKFLKNNPKQTANTASQAE